MPGYWIDEGEGDNDWDPVAQTWEFGEPDPEIEPWDPELDQISDWGPHPTLANYDHSRWSPDPEEVPIECPNNCCCDRRPMYFETEAADNFLCSNDPRWESHADATPAEDQCNHDILRWEEYSNERTAREHTNHDLSRWELYPDVDLDEDTPPREPV